MKKAHPYEEVAFDVYPMENIWKEVGSGMVGDLSEEMDALEFLKSLKNNYEKRNVCVIHFRNKKNVKRVAVCGGSGSFLLGNAIGAGADIFITGDYKIPSIL